MRRQKRFSQAGETISSVFKQMGLERKTLERQAAMFWAEIVGDQIARATKVDKVWEGTLYVSCKNSVWANELLLHRQQILKSIAERIGAGIIKEIQFSGRGFRKTEEKEEQAEPEKEPTDAPLAPGEVQEVDKIVSSVEDSDLAQVIRKALLTTRRRTP